MKADHLNPTQYNNNAQSKKQENSKSSFTDFISYIQWCNFERSGDYVKINWSLMLEQLENVSGKNVSGNKMKKYFSLFGLNDWVSLRELSQAVMNYINK